MKIRRSTPEEDQYIRDNYLKIPASAMSRHLNRPPSFALSRLRILGLIVPEEIKSQFRDIHAFKKGHISPFRGTRIEDRFSPEQIEVLKKTQFKKGSKPANVRQIGDIKIHTDWTGKQYKMVKVKASSWRPLHLVNWEGKYGKVPKGSRLYCKTNDRLNCETDNWEVITRKESILRNSSNVLLKDRYVASNISRDPELKEEIIKNHPQIIELKRQQILLNREIKKYA